ncbi:MAG TPA: hypothetical protein VEW47_15460 [Candidatus Dormibacteraeota bacterium]|nr:hypothetical protein [Candidatus Dormibacteraeota bacterium]
MGLCVLVLPGVPPALADDRAAASSSDKSGQEPDSTEAARSATSQPATTPAPKPSPTPKTPATQAKRPAAAAKPAAPAQAPTPTLRFDDFDLEKFHKPIPQPEDGESEEEEGLVIPAGPTAAASPAPATTIKGPRAKTRPKPIAAQPEQDPLKPFKEREAKEKFRQMQIETGRDRIAKLQARLDYLNAKRDALTNPAPLLAGQTQTQNPPAKPGEPPPPPTPIQGPGRGLTATPGAGKFPVAGLFPPLPPPQTDEDKENDKKLKVRDLIDQVEAEIKSVTEELETARDELASVETRFAQESQSR